MKNVYETYDDGDARLLGSILTANGILNQVRVSIGGHAGTTVVWITSDSDYEWTIKLVSEYDQSKQVPQKQGWPWKCTKCGEQLESEFTECWKCGTSRS